MKPFKRSYPETRLISLFITIIITNGSGVLSFNTDSLRSVLNGVLLTLGMDSESAGHLNSTNTRHLDLNKTDFDIDLNLTYLTSTGDNNATSWPESFVNKSPPVTPPVTKCCKSGQHLVLVPGNTKSNSENSQWTCTTPDEITRGGRSTKLSEFLKWSIGIFSSPEDHSATRIVSFQSASDSSAFNGLPRCRPEQNLHSLVNGEETWFRILESGEVVVGLHFWFWPIWLPVVGEYCIEPQTNVSEVLLFCELEGYELYIYHREIYGITFIMSAFFLFLTLLIYHFTERNFALHISNFTALFFFYVVEGNRIFVKLDGLNITLGHWCFYHAIISQYFAIVFSATLTVLGFDMLWTFWKIKVVGSLSNARIFFCIFLPWIVPLIGLVGGLVYNHYTNPYAPREEIGMFEFGYSRCTSPAWDIGIIIHSTLFLCTIVYFILGSFMLFKKLYNSRYTKTSSRSVFASESFGLLMKISVLMGVKNATTISELHFGAKDPLAWYWACSRIFLFGLQGMWLFFAFGCTHQNRRVLYQKFPLLGKIRGFESNAHADTNRLTVIPSSL